MGQVDVRDLQAEIKEWHHRNFPMTTTVLDQVALTEEVGELSRAIVKMHTGYRGTKEEWLEEAYKEIGDVFISLSNIATDLDIDLTDAINDRWLVISKRDWNADRIQHGIERQ